MTPMKMCIPPDLWFTWVALSLNVSCHLRLVICTNQMVSDNYLLFLVINVLDTAGIFLMQQVHQGGKSACLEIWMLVRSVKVANYRADGLLRWDPVSVIHIHSSCSALPGLETHLFFPHPFRKKRLGQFIYLFVAHYFWLLIQHKAYIL